MACAQHRFCVCIALSLAAHTAIIALPRRTAIPYLRVYSPPLFVSLPSSIVESGFRKIPAPSETIGGNIMPAAPQQQIVEVATPNHMARQIQIASELPAIYIPAKELTRKPAPLIDLDELSWRLPPQAHGTVILTLYLSANGAVDRFEFDSPVSSELHTWIKDSLMKGTRFSPGERQGIPVQASITIQLELSALRR